MKGATSTAPSRLASQPLRAAIVQSVGLAIACLISYVLITQLLARAYAVSRSDDALGGMWAVIATIFVFRLSYQESAAAAVSRMAATLLSFFLCLVYLLALLFSVWGLVVLIGVGALVMTLLGRPRDVVTTGITTAVILVVASLSPHNAWEQPILRLVDTVAGVAVGLVVAWIGLQAMELRRRAVYSHIPARIHMSDQINQDQLRSTTAASEFNMVGPADTPSSTTASTTQPADLPTTMDERTVQQMQRTTPAAAPLPFEGEMPSLDGATAWLNSPPLTAGGLRGKVVLINFWTYTCINWLRTLPYVRAWAEKYQNQGLVVIGVHTPEFAFEHDIENVRRAAQDMRVAYPIAIDNEYAIWNAFNNHYWPALYFVDAMGHIRYHHFGEGAYEQSELIIQQLLAEAGILPISGTGHELVALDASDARGVEAAADWDDVQSPETYLGYERTEGFASPGGAILGDHRVYVAPARLSLNQWALAGEWTMEQQASVLHTANGRIAYCFHARDLHLVMGPAARGTSARFRVRINGQPPGAAHGLDVDDQGNGIVTQQRLYQLIRQQQPIADHQFEIEFLDAGVEAFAFTFG